MAEEEVERHGAAILAVTKPRTKSAGDEKVQVNLRLTAWIRWKLYRYSKEHRIGQSEAARRVLTEFFTDDDVESDWRSKKQ